MATTGRKDYYAVLGIPRDADQAAVKRAFRDLARRYHPDRSTEPDAQERFEEVSEAYAVLSDPDKRSDYDRHGRTSLDRVSVEDLLAGLDLADLFGDPGGPGPGVGGDPFEGFYGVPGGPAARGADVEVGLTVPLATVLTGGTGTVTLRGLGRCAACGGSGAAPGTRPHACYRCGGTGTVLTERRRGRAVVRQVATCTACGGAGRVVERPCPACAGQGQTERNESVTLRIPPGIAEGTALRLPGRGMPAPAGGRPGDAFVVVRTSADPRFVRRGAELWHGEEVTVPDAVLGTTLTVSGLDGEVLLGVPPGTQPGTVLRVPGRGLPHGDGRGRGDLRVPVTVRIPDHPGDVERELYRQLREAANAVLPEPVGRRRWWQRWWQRWWRRSSG